MDTQKLKVILIVVVSLFLALYLGVAAATAQLEALAWVGGALALVLILALGRHVWVLIPVSLGLAGHITFVPGSPSPWWLAVAAVFGVFALRFSLRKLDLDFRLNWLDFAIFLQMVAIAQAYIRNPAGLSILGGDVVGGKPYIYFGFAFVAFFLMSFVKTEAKVIKWLVIAAIFVSVMDGGLQLLSFFVPVTAAFIYPFYSGVSFQAAYTGSEAIDTEDARLGGAKDMGKALGLATFTLFRPITCLNPFYPLRFLMMASSVGLVMLSGFRSTLFLLVAIAITSSLVRRKVVDVFVCGFLGFVAIALLVMTDTIQNLPFGAQRILSVLPVNVRDDAREGAIRSSEWRFEMWELALTTDRYIANKWLGDGFAFRSDELALMLDAALGKSRGGSEMQSLDLMMAKGSYHGFHVETIRMTGALGLLCALIGLGIFFRYAWLQIQHFRGRPEWPYILYLCIPFLIHPFYLMLVFGAYRSGFPEIIVAAAMLKVLDNIRVRELAAARAEVPLSSPKSAAQPEPTLPPGRLPQPVMRTQ